MDLQAAEQVALAIEPDGALHLDAVESGFEQLDHDLAGQLNRLVIASIGPVCSKALREHGITPTFEADPPKLGPLIAGLEAALG